MRPPAISFLLFLTIALAAAACSAPPEPRATVQPEPTANVEATVQARLQEERAKLPTATPRPEVLTESDAAARLLPSVVRVSNSTGMGSGVVVGDGLVVTNRHVVEDDDTATVMDSAGGSFDGKVAAKNSMLDSALLRVPGLKAPPVQFADLSRMKPGEPVLAIGYPLDLKGDATVTRGLFSAIRVGEPVPGEWVQTDAAVNPGNSGGPLANLRGEVFGLITLRRLSDDQMPVQGINFALSATSLRDVIPAMQLSASVTPQGAVVAPADLTKEIGEFLQRYDAAESVAFSTSDDSGLKELSSPSLFSLVSLMIKQQKALNVRRDSTLVDFRVVSVSSLPDDLVVADVFERWHSRTFHDDTLVEDEGETDQPQVAVVRRVATGWQLAAVQFKESEATSGAKTTPTRTPIPRRPTPTPTPKR